MSGVSARVAAIPHTISCTFTRHNRWPTTATPVLSKECQLLSPNASVPAKNQLAVKITVNASVQASSVVRSVSACPARTENQITTPSSIHVWKSK